MKYERLRQLRHDEALFADNLCCGHPGSSAFDMTFVRSRCTGLVRARNVCSIQYVNEPAEDPASTYARLLVCVVSNCCNLFYSIRRLITFNHIHGCFFSQVLAKFLGLLTFSPNWGISALDSASSRHEPPLASANEQVRLEKGIAFVL